mmetsp:Transcript_41105/g.96743  ORF Transcript_41105/g.96743 Transcript_41105/m.96743 type:complete len:207 (+) Transcript_41105:2-622(+)
MKKRVLVIDCDPQCNLTSFFIPPTDGDGPDGTAGPNPHTAAGGVAPLVEPQDVIKANTRPAIKNLASLEQGEFAGLGIRDVNTCMKSQGMGMDKLKAPEHYFQPFPTDLNDNSVVGDRLLIIPGSSCMYDFDETLNAKKGDVEVMYQTALCTFVRQAAYLTNAEYVIIDCGPSSSMLNKNILILSDYILPPTFCDYFSLASMHCKF